MSALTISRSHFYVFLVALTGNAFALGIVVGSGGYGRWPLLQCAAGIALALAVLWHGERAADAKRAADPAVDAPEGGL